MIEKIYEELIEFIGRGHQDIYPRRINEIKKLISKKIGEKEILGYIITVSYESYPGTEEYPKIPIQITILTEKFIFELIFGKDTLKYDITWITDIGILQVYQEPLSVGTKIHLRNMSNLYCSIFTYDKNKFNDLIKFIGLIEKLSLKNAGM